MKRIGLLLLILLVFATVLLSIHYYCLSLDTIVREEFFFGVSFGQDTVEEAKLLIDKVKVYTNFFLINNWNIVENETALNEVSEHAVEAKLNFMVFFVIVRPWHLAWLEMAEVKWGERFLGAYLYDEPGGNQIDRGRWFSDAGAVAFPEYADEYARILANASDYGDATNLFATSVSSYYMQYLKGRNIHVFTSDYALYWFDYLAGYDTVFVQLGWNHNTTQHIALCRGAANVQGKDWGAFITWTYYEPPYLANGTEILAEMLAAYHAGAKYVVIFNYARDPETEKAYSILTESHFEAMQGFWAYVQAYPERHGQVGGNVAFVLPKDYGWGMRHPEDSIWGWWSVDEKAPLIWENVNKLIEKYGFELDIVYDDDRFRIEEKYLKVYFWNATINI